MKKLKVFLDARRDPPNGWIRAAWPQEVIAWLQTGTVAAISLSDDGRGTGYAVLRWLEDAVSKYQFDPPIITVHAASPRIRLKLLACIRRIKKITENQYADP